jgi:uncharacterized membrane protein YfcA
MLQIALLGALVGVAPGLTGAGGGIIAIPLATLGLGLGVALVSHTQAPVLSMMLAAVMVTSSVAVHRRSRSVQSSAPLREQPACGCNASTGRLVWTPRCASTMTVIGASTGWLSGLLGVGGGFVLGPALTRVTDVTVRGIVATSQAVIAIVSMSGMRMARNHRCGWAPVRWP